jgi:hypothetical protein
MVSSEFRVGAHWLQNPPAPPKYVEAHPLLFFFRPLLRLLDSSTVRHLPLDHPIGPPSSHYLKSN